MGTYLGTSSFVVQPYNRKALREYCSRMSKDNLDPLWDDNIGRVLREQGLDITESPRSIYKVEKLYEALDKFEPEKAPEFNARDVHVREGLHLANLCFSKPKGQPYLTLPAFTPEFVIKVTSNPQGSAGLTAWGMSKTDAFVRAFQRGCQIIKGVKKPEPCIAFKRTQFNDKTRLVWGYPYSMTAIEGLFFRPIIDQFKKKPQVMAFAMPDMVLGGKLRNSANRKEWCYVTDVSSFDSSLSAGLIHRAFLALRTWFDLSQIEPTTGVKYGDIFDLVEHYFIHTPIVMPNGKVYKGKKHGVPSGSYGTQWVDSYCNVVQAGTAGSRFHLNLDKRDILALGDDMCFWSDIKIDYTKLASYLSATFSATLKPEKGARYHFDEPIKFLGRYWERGIPDLAVDDILIRMAFPETYRKYDRDPVIRKAQVEQMLASFATQYKSASQVYELVVVNKRTRFEHTINDYVIDSLNARRRTGRGEDIVEVDSKFLTGLQRYKVKYLGHHTKGTPLELQFWL